MSEETNSPRSGEAQLGGGNIEEAQLAMNDAEQGSDDRDADRH